MALAAVLLVSALSILGCRGERVDPFEAPDPELATEEVAALPTDGLSPEDDVRGVQRDLGNELVGRLPSSFPADLPVFRPASVTDFSSPNEIPRMVELTIARPRDAVASFYKGQLSAQGWQAVSADQWKKGERRIEVTIESVGGGDTTARILY